MAVKTDPIDVTNPAGSRDPKLGDDDIRTLARAAIELINEDHYVGANGGAGTGYNEDAAGEHAKITFQAPLASHPANVSNKGHIYTKDVSGVPELFFQDEGGNSKQITTGGKLNIVDADGAVVKTGAQTIAGVKTFSSSPIVPAPTTDLQASTKKYVDDIMQVVNTQTGAVNTGTTTIPDDDTIPQKTEGDEYMTLAITPKSATNKLKIEVVIHLGHSNVSGDLALVAALFQDSTASALAATYFRESHNRQRVLSFTHYMTTGTTSATTFKVRAGCSSAGTTTFNGYSGARKLGGVMASSITITEIRP